MHNLTRLPALLTLLCSPLQQRNNEMKFPDGRHGNAHSWILDALINIVPSLEDPRVLKLFVHVDVPVDKTVTQSYPTCLVFDDSR